MTTTKIQNKCDNNIDRYILNYIHKLEAVNIAMLPDDKIHADSVIGDRRNRPNPYIYPEYSRPSNDEARKFARGVIMKNLYPSPQHYRFGDIHIIKKAYLEALNILIAIKQRRLNFCERKEIKNMAKVIIK